METDVVTITEVIAYISASAAAILYIVDTIIPWCQRSKKTKQKNDRNKNEISRKKNFRRSSHWQFKRSVRRSPRLESDSLRSQYAEELEGLVVSPQPAAPAQQDNQSQYLNIVVDKRKKSESPSGFSNMYEDDINNVFLD